MMQEAGSAYIVAAVADAPPRSLPHDQHVHLCLYRARGVQRLPAPICRFPVGVTGERIFEKFSIVILRTNIWLWKSWLILHFDLFLYTMKY